MNIEIDCTPEEARSFLGLPDVAPLNQKMVEEMQRRMEANISALQPEEIYKAWASFGGQAQEQMRKLMTAAAEATLSGRTRRP